MGQWGFFSWAQRENLLHFLKRKEETIIEEMAPYCRGKIPVFFGVTCGSTMATIELAQFAQEKGADGIMFVVPPYVAPPQGAVYDFLKSVCQSVDISVAIYNNPARVIVNIDPLTIVKLVRRMSQPGSR